MVIDWTSQMTPHGDVDGFTWADESIGYSLVRPIRSTTTSAGREKKGT